MDQIGKYPDMHANNINDIKIKGTNDNNQDKCVEDKLGCIICFTPIYDKLALSKC